MQSLRSAERKLWFSPVELEPKHEAAVARLVDRVTRGHTTVAQGFVEPMRLHLARPAPKNDRVPAGSPRTLLAEAGQRPSDPHSPCRGGDRKAREFRLTLVCDDRARRVRREQHHHPGDGALSRTGSLIPAVDDEDLATTGGIVEVGRRIRLRAPTHTERDVRLRPQVGNRLSVRLDGLANRCGIWLDRGVLDWLGRMARDHYASPFGAAFSACMERPRLSRAIGRLFWGIDLRPFYKSMTAVEEVAEGGTVVDCPCGAGLAVRALGPDAGVRYLAADLSPSRLRGSRPTCTPRMASRCFQRD